MREAMFETFLDLPLHILVIHAVVVGVPVAALVTVIVAFVPSLRARFAWAVVVLDALMVGATYAAQESGKWFYDKLGAPQSAANHRELGLTLIWFAIGLFVAALLLALVSRAGGVLAGVVAVVVLVAAGAAAVQVARVGDTGSRAVWGGTVTSK
jgi:hypothetical protein